MYSLVMSTTCASFRLKTGDFGGVGSRLVSVALSRSMRRRDSALGGVGRSGGVVALVHRLIPHQATGADVLVVAAVDAVDEAVRVSRVAKVARFMGTNEGLHQRTHQHHQSGESDKEGELHFGLRFF